MIGRRFGNWVVIETDPRHIENPDFDAWYCHCECGYCEWISRPRLISGDYPQCHKCGTTYEVEEDEYREV